MRVQPHQPALSHFIMKITSHSISALSLPNAPLHNASISPLGTVLLRMKTPLTSVMFHRVPSLSHHEHPLATICPVENPLGWNCFNVNLTCILQSNPSPSLLSPSHQRKTSPSIPKRAQRTPSTHVSGDITYVCHFLGRGTIQAKTRRLHLHGH